MEVFSKDFLQRSFFKSLVFPKEKLEKDDDLQSREFMDKNLWSIFDPVTMATGMDLQP